MGRPSFRVFWPETATRDLEDLVRFIADDSSPDARRILARLKGRAAALKAHPERGRPVPELSVFGFGAWRELIVKPYRLIYAVKTTGVYILAVLDGRRDLEDLLFARLVRP